MPRATATTAKSTAPRHSSRRLGGWLAATLTFVSTTVVLASGDAWAQGDVAAEGLFRQGRKLMNEEKYAEACPLFEESQRIDPSLGTLLNVAICHDKIGRTASAWAEFRQVASDARVAGDSAREDFARSEAARLEPLLSRVTLSAAGTRDGLTVKLDGEALSGSVLGVPLPVDPGKRVIEASAPGKKTWRQELDVPAGASTLTVTIPVLEDAPAEVIEPQPPAGGETATLPPPKLVPVPPEPAEPPDDGGIPVWAYVGFGVGGAGVIVGAITGGVSLSQTSDIQSRCVNGSCPASEDGAISEANTLANVSNVSFAIGGAGLIVGVIGFIVGSQSETEAATVTPVIGPGYAGLRGSF